MSPTSDRFEVNVIFRGLFLAQPTEAGIAVLLPDAREPNSRVNGSTDPLQRALSRISPYREHQGIIEFRRSDWQIPTRELPDVLWVDKRSKGEMAFAILGSLSGRQRSPHSIRFSTLSGDAPALPGSLKAKPGEYNTSRLKSKTLQLLEGNHELAFDKLPRFGSAVKDGAWGDTIGFCHFEHGEVFSERRCKNGDGDLEWYLPTVKQLPNLARALHEVESRSINLDLRVRFMLAATDELVLEVLSVPPGTSAVHPTVVFLPDYEGSPGGYSFRLKPSDPSAPMEIWIKNRELDRALLESDRLEDSVLSGGGAVGIDVDHGLFMPLATHPELVTIPRVKGGTIANAGCACGGCGGGTSP